MARAVTLNVSPSAHLIDEEAKMQIDEAGGAAVNRGYTTPGVSSVIKVD